MSAYILYFEMSKKKHMISRDYEYIIPRNIGNGKTTVSYLKQNFPAIFIVNQENSINFYDIGDSREKLRREKLRHELLSFILCRVMTKAIRPFLFFFIMHENQWPKIFIINSPAVKIAITRIEDEIFKNYVYEGVYEVT